MQDIDHMILVSDQKKYNVYSLHIQYDIIRDSNDKYECITS